MVVVRNNFFDTLSFFLMFYMFYEKFLVKIYQVYTQKNKFFKIKSDAFKLFRKKILSRMADVTMRTRNVGSERSLEKRHAV